MVFERMAMDGTVRFLLSRVLDKTRLIFSHINGPNVSFLGNND